MISRLLLIAGALCLSSPAFSQECSAINQVIGADFRSEFKTLENRARRLGARADGLQFQLSEYPS